MLFPYVRVVGFALTVALLYFFWEWGAAKAVLDTLHPPVTVSVQLVGRPAPELHVNKSQVWSKQDFFLKELRGYPVVVHFWATWCGPCLEELPTLLARARELRAQGYSVVAVAVDDSWARVDEFFARYPQLADLRNQTILILDPGGAIAGRFGSSRFPETFLINSEGVIDNKFVGPQPWSDPQILPYLQRLRPSGKPLPAQ